MASKIIIDSSSGQISYEGSAITLSPPQAEGMLIVSNGSTVNQQPVSTTFKNRIINGGMVIDQRNNGAAVGKDSFIVDRWLYSSTITGGVYSASRSSTVPTGFTNSIYVTPTTGTSPGAGEYMGIYYHLEGYHSSDFAWGTSSARSVTLSFWVRSSVTGIYGVRFMNYGYWNYARMETYTINSPNVWEKKTITITGAPAGTWNNNENGSIQVWFDLGSGSNLYGTPGSWGASGAATVSNRASFASTTGASFYMTGVQLELSSVATAFEYRPFHIELNQCRRYYTRLGRLSTADTVPFGTLVSYGGSPPTVYYYGMIYSAKRMRASPTVVIPATGNFEVKSNTSWYPAAWGTIVGYSTEGFLMYAALNKGSTPRPSGGCILTGGTAVTDAPYIEFIAEL